MSKLARRWHIFKARFLCWWYGWKVSEETKLCWRNYIETGVNLLPDWYVEQKRQRGKTGDPK